MSDTKSMKDIAVEYYHEFGKEFNFYFKKQEELKLNIFELDEKICDLIEQVTKLQASKAFIESDLETISEDVHDCACMREILRTYISQEYPDVKLDD